VGSTPASAIAPVKKSLCVFSAGSDRRQGGLWNCDSKRMRQARCESLGVSSLPLLTAAVLEEQRPCDGGVREVPEHEARIQRHAPLCVAGAAPLRVGQAFEARHAAAVRKERSASRVAVGSRCEEAVESARDLTRHLAAAKGQVRIVVSISTRPKEASSAPHRTCTVTSGG
jgi:hypothetical protein